MVRRTVTAWCSLGQARRAGRGGPDFGQAAQRTLRHLRGLSGYPGGWVSVRNNTTFRPLDGSPFVLHPACSQLRPLRLLRAKLWGAVVLSSHGQVGFLKAKPAARPGISFRGGGFAGTAEDLLCRAKTTQSMPEYYCVKRNSCRYKNYEIRKIVINRNYEDSKSGLGCLSSGTQWRFPFSGAGKTGQRRQRIFGQRKFGQRKFWQIGSDMQRCQEAGGVKRRWTHITTATISSVRMMCWPAACAAGLPGLVVADLSSACGSMEKRQLSYSGL